MPLHLQYLHNQLPFKIKDIYVTFNLIKYKNYYNLDHKWSTGKWTITSEVNMWRNKLGRGTKLKSAQLCTVRAKDGGKRKRAGAPGWGKYGVIRAAQQAQQAGYLVWPKSWRQGSLSSLPPERRLILTPTESRARALVALYKQNPPHPSPPPQLANAHLNGSLSLSIKFANKSANSRKKAYVRKCRDEADPELFY
jgi:hypothetical protein